MIVLIEIMNSKMIVDVQHPDFTDELTMRIDVTTIMITRKRMFMAWILTPMMNRGVVVMQHTMPAQTMYAKGQKYSNISGGPVAEICI